MRRNWRIFSSLTLLLLIAYQVAAQFPDRAWQQLEVLGYDLNTCMGETTVILKSFFCALPPEELEAFRAKLVNLVPGRFAVNPGQKPPVSSD